MTRTDDDSKWQLGLGRLDSEPEDEELLDYSRLLAPELDSKPAGDARAARAKATAPKPR